MEDVKMEAVEAQEGIEVEKAASEPPAPVKETPKEETQRDRHYWLYAAGGQSKKFDEFYQQGIMGIGWEELGNFEDYKSREDMRLKMKEIYTDNTTTMSMSALITWQFYHDMQVGDVVFVKEGRSKVIGRGVVVSDYQFDAGREEYNHIRKVKWTNRGEWAIGKQTVIKTLTDITSYTGLVKKINALIEGTDDVSGIALDDEQEKELKEYSKDDFLREVYMTEDAYDELVGLLEAKKNIILQGAPGVGKTFAAERLAYSIMGKKDDARVMMVQFHQSYSYEDFIEGYRPTDTGFELRRGAFYDFCKLAQDDQERKYFFIIDEINRGNISKIFGELFMLIENSYRGKELRLLYDDEMFSVPKNVYIIGMMNTADRSLAMLDYALRRRFAFVEMKPGFETKGFKDYQKTLGSDKLDKLIDCVESLNETIAKDESLGKGFCIGHSYFCNLKADKLSGQTLGNIVEYELIPLLNEYWFDEQKKVEEWSKKLKDAIK